MSLALISWVNNSVPSLFRLSFLEGAIVGLTEILLNQPRIRDIVASTIVEAHQIEAAAMRGLIANDEGLALKSWQMAGVNLAARMRIPEFEHLDYTELQKLFR